MTQPEIRAHARGTVTSAEDIADQERYDREHDEMQQGVICDESDEDSSG